MVFTNAPSINSDHTKWNMTWAVLIHIQIETIGVLDHSSSLFFFWVVFIDYFVYKVSSLLLVFKNKAKCHVCNRCNKDAIMYELQKAIKLQRCSQTLISWNCPLRFRVITVWGKRWNFTHLFGCCTTHSMSLSLRCWSFDLIFVGSWRLKEHWARTSWQIFL